MEITLDAVKNNIETLTAWVDEQLEAKDCSPKSNMQIDVAIDEIFSNIANYAYGEKVGQAVISLDFDTLDDSPCVRIVFKDCGIPFNPLEKDDPDVTLGIAERQIGGLGIFMVKKIMDVVSYEYKDGRNVFTMVKKL